MGAVALRRQESDKCLYQSTTRNVLQEQVSCQLLSFLGYLVCTAGTECSDKREGYAFCTLSQPVELVVFQEGVLQCAKQIILLSKTALWQLLGHDQ